MSRQKEFQSIAGLCAAMSGCSPPTAPAAGSSAIFFARVFDTSPSNGYETQAVPDVVVKKKVVKKKEQDRSYNKNTHKHEQGCR